MTKPYCEDDLGALYLHVDGETPGERRKRLARERARRYRARQAGIEVPYQPRPKGYRQSEEHRRNRSEAIKGDKHHRWAGDLISEKGGRKRALRMYPDLGPCSLCGAPKAERHHIDANTANNDPSNIAVLCRRCHMETDGRLDAVIARPYRGIA